LKMWTIYAKERMIASKVEDRRTNLVQRVWSLKLKTTQKREYKNILEFHQIFWHVARDGREAKLLNPSFWRLRLVDGEVPVATWECTAKTHVYFRTLHEEQRTAITYPTPGERGRTNWANWRRPSFQLGSSLSMVPARSRSSDTFDTKPSDRIKISTVRWSNFDCRNPNGGFLAKYRGEPLRTCS
jgi:hypothetical protein